MLIRREAQALQSMNERIGGVDQDRAGAPQCGPERPAVDPGLGRLEDLRAEG